MSVCTKFGRGSQYVSTYRQGPLDDDEKYTWESAHPQLSWQFFFFVSFCYSIEESERALARYEKAARTKQRRERDKDSINYICEFKARPHILTRTHEMQMCPIVIGRMPHSSGIHI